ncbi:MAG TPA: VOC family protein [Solirubrobacterales bacterium]|nr:VOC family protein [Solirubrobacterales bacterium]
MITGVHHVGILVADLEQALAFLTGPLGLEVAKRVTLEAESTEIAFVECNGVQLELIEISDPEVRARRSRVPGATAEIEHIALAVDDLDSEAVSLAQSGARFSAGAGKTEETTTPLEVAGTKSLFTIRDSTAGSIWQLIEEL